MPRFFREVPSATDWWKPDSVWCDALESKTRLTAIGIALFEDGEPGSVFPYGDDCESHLFATAVHR